MSYEHCETHDDDATNGCRWCHLEEWQATRLRLFSVVADEKFRKG